MYMDEQYVTGEGGGGGEGLANIVPDLFGGPVQSFRAGFQVND